MYDELVERLRYCANPDNQCLECKYRGGSPDGSKMCFDLLMEDAADAVEKLVEVIQNHNFLESLIKPYWIPVTEEPPLKVGDDGYNGYLVFANGYYEVADYTTDEFDNVPYFHVNGEFEPNVTHFMPLPEPPKEET